MTAFWKFCVNAQSATSTIPRKNRWQRTLLMRARWNVWLARRGIKLMVNLLGMPGGSEPRSFIHRGESGQVGPVQRIIGQYGHRGPKEIGVSQYFADWLYDPVKTVAGDHGFWCYGAEWALWLKGRPTRVLRKRHDTKGRTAQQSGRRGDHCARLSDATVTIQASWNWPYSKSHVEGVWSKRKPDCGARLSILPLRGSRWSQYCAIWRAPDPELASTRNQQSVSYFIRSIRDDKVIEDLFRRDWNVQLWRFWTPRGSPPEPARARTR